MTRRLLTFVSIQQNLPKILFLTLLFSLYQPFTAAQVSEAQQAEAARPLRLGETIGRELSGGQSHTYTIQVAAGTYMRMLIAPQEIAITSSLFAGSSAAEVGVAHYPSGRGLRFLSVIAETSDNYRLEIRPSVDDAKAGRYEVKIEELRPATEQDKIRCAAEKAEDEGRVTMLETVQAVRQATGRHEEALRLWRLSGDRKSELRVLVYLSTEYKLLGEKQTALEYHKLAIELARKLGDHYHEANLILGFGEMHYSLGETQKALDAFHQARQLFKNHAKKYGEALAVYDIGAVLFNLGELTSALSYLEEALPAFSSFGDVFSECKTLDAIGKIHAHMGDRQKAVEFYNRALAVARTSKSVLVEAFSLGNLGNLYFESGDRQKALDFFEQSLTLCKTVAHSRCEGDALRRIGELA